MSFQRGILASLRRNLPALSELVLSHGDKNQHALCAVVCERFGFVDARGRIQRSGCLKALLVLDAEGRIALLAAQHDLRITGPRLLDTAVPEAKDVPSEVRDIADLEIILVETSSRRAIWNTTMDREHACGVATFAGAQLRYLIRTAHGNLGAVGFSAAALYLHPRNTWMAWDAAKREQHPHRVAYSDNVGHHSGASGQIELFNDASAPPCTPMRSCRSRSLLCRQRL